MTASPTAVELARACVMVVESGIWHHVRIVPPGTDPKDSVHWITVTADLAAQHVDAAVAVLAPFVDLGLARGRLAPVPPALGPWVTVAPCPEPPRTVAPEVPYTVDDEDDQEVD